MAAARREPVAQGGLFSTRKATFSRETQELLKVMMEESKLTNFQQRRLREQMQRGESLSLRCPPTSSRPGRPAAASGGGKKPSSQRPRQGLRTKDTIERMTDHNREPEYRPSPGRYNSTKEKEKLQNVMAYGTDLEPTPPTKPQPPPQETEKVDRFEEVLQEIEERRQFLEGMEALGQGKQHRNKIMTEISQKIRELEIIDRQRCSELLQEDLVSQ